jgi:hypothetical protein
MAAAAAVTAAAAAAAPVGPTHPVKAQFACTMAHGSWQDAMAEVSGALHPSETFVRNKPADKQGQQPFWTKLQQHKRCMLQNSRTQQYCTSELFNMAASLK